MAIFAGFDPSFEDILVKPVNSDGMPVDHLPPLNSHHRNTIISKSAGGNGVNVFRTLLKIGLNAQLVVPLNRSFHALLLDEGITDSRIHQIYGVGINTTVALLTSQGEIQFNDVTNSLSKIHWTRDVHRMWDVSELRIITNWGLNVTSNQWGAIQLLAAAGYSWDEIQDLDSYLPLITSDLEFSKPLVIDPGLVYSHSHRDELVQMLMTVSQLDNVYLLGNEEETIPLMPHLVDARNLVQHFSRTIFVHSNKRVKTYAVPPLPPTSNPRFVGAGDAFLAGYVQGIMEGMGEEDLITNAIEVARSHILSDFSAFSLV